MTILPLSPPVTTATKDLLARLALPVLVSGLVLCTAGYLALGWLVLRAVVGLL